MLDRSLAVGPSPVVPFNLGFKLREKCVVT